MILSINGILDQGFAEGLGFTEGEQIGEKKVDATKARIVEVLEGAIGDFGGFAEELLDEEVCEDLVVAEVPEGAGF